MANFTSKYADKVQPMPVAKGAEVVCVRMAVAVTTALASGDTLQFGELPEDHVPVDMVADSDDLDTHATPTITLSVGLADTTGTVLSSAAAQGGAYWLTDSTLPQAGGIARPTAKAITRVTPSATLRRMVLGQVTAAGATKAAGTVGVTLQYRAAHYGA